MAALGALEAVRSRVLIRSSLQIDALLSSRVMSAMVEQSLVVPGAQRAQALRDLDNFRTLATGTGLLAMLDLPWALLFIGVLFLIHLLLGVTALFFGLLLVGLAIFNEHLGRQPPASSNQAAMRSYASYGSHHRQRLGGFVT